MIAPSADISIFNTVHVHQQVDSPAIFLFATVVNNRILFFHFHFQLAPHTETFLITTLISGQLWSSEHNKQLNVRVIDTSEGGAVLNVQYCPATFQDTIGEQRVLICSSVD
jgi:hypothetical protein